MDEKIAPTIAPLRYLGTCFTPLTLDQILRLLENRDPADKFAYVVTPNAQHVVYAAHGDKRFQTPVERAWLAPNDSRIVARLAKLFRHLDLPACPGSDLTALLLDHVIGPADQIAIIGGNDSLASALRARYQLSALVQHQPPMGFMQNPAAVAACVAFAQTHPARFLFIACGAPQSEQLALIIEQAGATGVGLCVGASLQFLTGQAKRAPRWVQRWGLESIYRLAQEPARLGRRFVTGQLPIIWLAVKDAITKPD